MNKTIGIIGCAFFIASVAVGVFAKFDNAIILQIAFAAFGLATLIYGAYKQGKEKNVPTWQLIVIIAGAVIGGFLCALGGITQDTMKEIAGLVVALLALLLPSVIKKMFEGDKA